ncbi:uncharacterized protein BJ171DRAFT_583826 [Polychytrium aggregatum]|uniref:uncharacterized protein n=1 Tax=Polychytrium aggregatum TaxID=110093 RepID=UPI0022FDCBC1|nr:uncharacterized protein BJ171DRAFT_583826 [Polychytrium aggregatum]KAI9202705.1 hypothetical protein BJ171DRAFT_583826 [Polychytrium aggregatum]
MPPKKKGKGKKSGGGKKRRKSSGIRMKGKPLTAEQASTLMTYLLVESRKQSIALYKEWCHEEKETMRRLRSKLKHIQQDQYETIKSTVDATETLDSRIITTESEQEQLPEMSIDRKLARQRDEIEELQTTLDRLEEEMSKIKLNNEDMTRFQNEGGALQLETVLSQLKEDALSARDRHEAEVESLKKKHENSLISTDKRAERIIEDLETVASKHVMGDIPDPIVTMVRKNRQLKANLITIRQEEIELKRKLQGLEQENMTLVERSIQVDWNMLYGDDGSLEFGVPSSSECDSDHSPEELSDDNDDQPDAQSLPSNPARCKPTAENDVDEPSVHDPCTHSRGSAKRVRFNQVPDPTPEEPQPDQREPARPTHPSGRVLAPLSSFTSSTFALPTVQSRTTLLPLPSNLDLAMKEVISLEMARRKKQTEQTGVNGMAVRLGKLDLELGGPPRYYSKLVNTYPYPPMPAISPVKNK